MSPYKGELNVTGELGNETFSFYYRYIQNPNKQVVPVPRKMTLLITSKSREFEPSIANIAFINGQDTPVVEFRSTAIQAQEQSFVEIEAFEGTVRSGYIVHDHKLAQNLTTVPNFE